MHFVLCNNIIVHRHFTVDMELLKVNVGPAKNEKRQMALNLSLQIIILNP